MTVKVKICGITTAEGMNATIAAGADWVGFNFFAASPRHITPTVAATLAARPGVPATVGLFVGPTDAEIAAILAVVRLDVLQIYADAPRAAEIRTRFNRPGRGPLVWRAIGVATPADLPRDAQGVDGFIIEAKSPPGATRPGGNAVAFDWSILANGGDCRWQAPAPWLLAGGLTPDNVGAAIRGTGAPGVDVSSGVERQKGVKDAALIAAFAAAVHGTNCDRRLRVD